MPLEYSLQFRGRFADANPWKLPRSVTAKLAEDLGVRHLPDQVVRKSKRTPFVLNVMVVGESGLGKTTFMNTLFSTDLKEDKRPRDLKSTKTVAVTPTTYELTEKDITLLLTVVDTPGFGDSLNREENLIPILNYIDAQNNRSFNLERSPELRKSTLDTRIHCLFYFLAPTGKGLRDLDIMALQKLSTKVNVVPVIAKADSLTKEEIQHMKKLILKDVQTHNIQIYPNAFSDERDVIASLETHVPFSIIGSDEFVMVNGKKVRGRTYRWGTVEVENAAHCDFIHLRTMLFQYCLKDLVETTEQFHYSEYRFSQLKALGRREAVLACDDFYDSRLEDERTRMLEEMAQKEDEMRQKFVMKVREKEAQLREKEEQLSNLRQQMMVELEELKRSIQDEQREFEELQRVKSLDDKGKKK